MRISYQHIVFSLCVYIVLSFPNQEWSHSRRMPNNTEIHCFLCMVYSDPWTAWIWTVWIHLYAGVFNKHAVSPLYCQNLHLWIQPTTDGKSYFGVVVGNPQLQRANCMWYLTPFHIRDLSIADFDVHQVLK